MKIKKVSIKNFKCLGPVPVVLDFSDDIVVLVGENNVGKSSFLKALNIFFSGTKTMPTEYFRNKKNDQENAVVIEVTFNDLSDGDKAHQAVSPYISTENDENLWILRKTYYYSEDGKGKCDYEAFTNGVGKKNPSGFNSICDDLFTDEKMQKIYVESVKHVSEVADGNSKAVFGQLFNLILRSELETTDEFKSLMAAFSKYSELFKGKSQLPKIKEVEDKITEKLSRIIKGKGIIDADVPKIEKVLPLPVLSSNDGGEINVVPEEQGSGFQRALIFVLLELFAESKSPDTKYVGPRNLLLIEEPEVYMHPQMERKIADVLYEIAASGKAQVICTTHSPIFIRPLESARSVVRVCKDEYGAVSIIQKSEDIFSGDNGKRKTIRMLMNFDASVNELFFAKRVVLLEGDTESFIFSRAAGLLGIFNDHPEKKREVSLINCRGRDSIPLFQAVLNFYEIPYIVVHDLESQAAGEGKNAEILQLLDSDEKKRMYFNKKIEDVLEISEGGRKWLKAIERVEELHASNELDTKIGSFVRFVYGV